MKIQTNCGLTKDRKVKGKLVRSKTKVEPEYRFLKDMVCSTLDIAELNETQMYRIYRDLGITGEKLKAGMIAKRVQIVSIEVTRDKLGICGL